MVNHSIGKSCWVRELERGQDGIPGKAVGTSSVIFSYAGDDIFFHVSVFTSQM